VQFSCRKDDLICPFCQVNYLDNGPVEILEWLGKSRRAVNLHNAVAVSQQRLGKRVAQLSSARMNEVCAALRFSLGCDAD
jgi:mRNA-degrading endonuclease toxin of MazEF toxin-antitoxin module